jgi:hypothetical protein
MYKELNNLLAAYTTDNAWYDDGCIIVSEMLLEFTKGDWEELASGAPTKPLEWQKKLAYCMDSNCNIYEFRILLSLLTIEDEELFTICIDTLRSFATPQNKEIILGDPSILYRINEILPKASLPVKKVLEDFLVNIR